MVKRETIEFVEARTPIRGHVTKFGGQPVWIDKSEWPLSKATGNPMRFICQIAIDGALFSPVSARMAYLFMTDEEDHVDGTWEPDGGENAVILQPGQIRHKTTLAPEGPTLYKMVKKLFASKLSPKPCEYSVQTTKTEDPDPADEKTQMNWSDDERNNYFAELEGNKIGGTPGFIQRAEFPGTGRWRLLLQLDSTKVPFFINFGDAGVGYLFLTEDGQIAKFLWQCC